MALFFLQGMATLDFPFPRGVIKRVPDPKSDAVGVFPQFARQGRGLRSVIPGPAKAGNAEGSSSAAAKASKQSPPLPPAPGLVTDHRQSPTPSIVSGCVKSGSTPARTSELFPEPLAPTTSTKGRCALTCPSKASNTPPIALVLPWKMGACSKSKTFSPRNGLDFHRRTFLLKSFWLASWST